MQAHLLTGLLKLVLSAFLLITFLVPGNPVGMGEKESWVHSALQSIRGCQGSGIEMMWPHSMCTLCCYIGSWRHEHFGMAFFSLLERGFACHCRFFLCRDVVVGLLSSLQERPMGSIT